MGYNAKNMMITGAIIASLGTPIAVVGYTLPEKEVPALSSRAERAHQLEDEIGCTVNALYIEAVGFSFDRVRGDTTKINELSDRLGGDLVEYNQVVDRSVAQEIEGYDRARTDRFYRDQWKSGLKTMGALIGSVGLALLSIGGYISRRKSQKAKAPT